MHCVTVQKRGERTADVQEARENSSIAEKTQAKKGGRSHGGGGEKNSTERRGNRPGGKKNLFPPTQKVKLSLCVGGGGGRL